MRSALAFRTFLVALALLAPVGVAVQGRDAGTNQEAGSTPETATPIGFGSYLASLNDQRDVDWYVLPSTQDARCVRVTGSGEADADAAIRLAGGAAPLDVRRDHNTLASALVVPLVEDLRFGVAMSAGGRPGTYAFAIEARDHASLGIGDGASGRDATSSDPVALAGCAAGTLESVVDARDAYVFDATAGDRLTLTFAVLGQAEDVYARLLAPDGTVLVAVADGGSATVEAPTTGTYRAVTFVDGVSTVSMQMSTQITETISYLLGMDAEKPGQACRPSCFSS